MSEPHIAEDLLNVLDAERRVRAHIEKLPKDARYDYLILVNEHIQAVRAQMLTSWRALYQIGTIVDRLAAAEQKDDGNG
jgi:hypothetical protein